MLRRLFCLLFLLILASPALAAPRVVASIPPLYGLTAGVMQGVGQPTLLLNQQASPHAASLRPSQARALASADLLVWIGPQLETFLDKPSRNLLGSGVSLSLVKVEGMQLLAQREGGFWDAEHDEHAHADGLEINPHLWLSPHNARRIVEVVSTRLQQIDPQNEAVYARNRDRMRGEITEAENRLRQRLAPLRDKPYLVFHDAYPYLESAFDLKAVGSIRVSPDRAPGARRLQQIREKIDQTGARCLFREPQFSPAVSSKLTRDTGIRLGTLDPLGVAVTPPENGWFSLMDSLADNLTQCLSVEQP